MGQNCHGQVPLSDAAAISMHNCLGVYKLLVFVPGIMCVELDIKQRLLPVSVSCVLKKFNLTLSSFCRVDSFKKLAALRSCHARKLWGTL